ncbi:prephenate dehydratase [Allokutzneria sp. NRRL B-24872]|uniref:prephenate dehydratase n=1 Tax=Allokutzneria sp. NRRL B-24872 TaxID=1137961 RepID=UPI000A3C186D|nr:prephenate dehydratase [Allokutzneria sp. NRRL B-24872]
MPRIAYLGPEGTFTEQAVRQLLADEAPAELIPAESVAAALDAVRSGERDAACVPIENSVEGSVTSTMDALVDGTPLVAVAETMLPVRFDILVRPGVRAEDVRTITSHPHALAQVRRWLSVHLPEAAQSATTSTSAAAVAVRDGAADAAVCAPLAAERYGLDVLAGQVADVEDAVTRFLLVRRPGEVPAPTGADRTTVVVVTGDSVGSLARVLNEFALRGVNLTRIESRPIKGSFGEYRFFLDFGGHVGEAHVGEALAALRRHCQDVRFLGSFPRADEGGSSGSDEAFTDAAAWLADIRSGGRA